VQVKVKPHPKFPAVFQVTLEEGSHRLATRNLTPGRQVYGERLVKYKGVEYRIWDAFRSKLAAAILKGLQTLPIKPNARVLYLGAASGTTASHVSDVVGEKGHVYCVEFAARSLRDLINNVCAFRLNMTPFLEDARLPEKYATLIPEKVECVYCDVAQPEQEKILADNADFLLKKPGWGMLAVKAQSIDVTKAPSEVYAREVSVLKKRGFTVDENIMLEPYDKAHAMVVAHR
jgi:fibrillarin-like pre-rRNA processing protein